MARQIQFVRAVAQHQAEPRAAFMARQGLARVLDALARIAVQGHGRRSPDSFCGPGGEFLRILHGVSLIPWVWIA
jgi:hypothetical protein